MFHLIIMDDWTILYRVPMHLLMYLAMQIVCKFLESPCSILGSNNLTATAYHLQMNGQPERFYGDFCQTTKLDVGASARLGHYVQPMTYVYIA